MNTVNDLRKRGFTVTSKKQGITEVYRDQKFYYFNPRFCEDASAVVNSIGNMQYPDGATNIVVAGQFADDAEFPFVMVEESQFENLLSKQTAFLEVRKQLTQAKMELAESYSNLF